MVDFVRAHSWRAVGVKGRSRAVSCYIRVDAIRVIWRDHPDQFWKVELNDPPPGFDSEYREGVTYIIDGDAFRKLTGESSRCLAAEVGGRVRWVKGPSSEQWCAAVDAAERGDEDTRRLFQEWATIEWD